MLIAGILIMSLVVGAGSGILSQLTAKNIDLTYPETKSEGKLFAKSEMMNFDNVKYEVKGNTIILNKPGLFQNREIAFSEEQTCLIWIEPSCIEFNPTECLEMDVRKPINCSKLENQEDEKSACIKWDIPKDCIEFDDKLGVCNKYETELSCLKQSEPTCKTMSERICSNWSKITRDEFIQQAIKQEIEFVKGVQNQRANRNQVDLNATGKVLIK
jgi:hypothetical protein